MTRTQLAASLVMVGAGFAHACPPPEPQLVQRASTPGPHRAEAIDALPDLCGDAPAKLLATLVLSADLTIASLAIEASLRSDAPIVQRALVTRLRDRFSPSTVRIDAWGILSVHGVKLATTLEPEIAKLAAARARDEVSCILSAGSYDRVAQRCW